MENLTGMTIRRRWKIFVVGRKRFASKKDGELSRDDRPLSLEADHRRETTICRR